MVNARPKITNGAVQKAIQEDVALTMFVVSKLRADAKLHPPPRIAQSKSSFLVLAAATNVPFAKAT